MLATTEALLRVGLQALMNYALLLFGVMEGAGEQESIGMEGERARELGEGGFGFYWEM